MKQPKFSVIVPVYKAESYLCNCVDSILAQTITDFELILVNDGSPDNSGIICDEYAAKDNRIKVLHKKNGGASDARNYGLDKAIGNRICFVDSDDIVDNNFLEIFSEKEADIVVQGMYRTMAVKHAQTKEEYYIPIEDGEYSNVKEFLDTVYKADNIGYLVTRAFKREIIESHRLRLNTEYQLREDMEFILRYTLACKSFATVNKGAYHYDVPQDFLMKYKKINQEKNFLCTVSIIKNYQRMAEMPESMVIQNVNSLSSSIIGMYKTSQYDINKMNDYLKFFCDFYRKCNNRKDYSKKSRFIYHLIGTKAPRFMHRIYNKVFSLI